MEELLDEAWHALFHLDLGQIERKPSGEQWKAYLTACEEGAKVRKKIEAKLNELRGG
jgi:hypothetical protein